VKYRAGGQHLDHLRLSAAPVIAADYNSGASVSGAGFSYLGKRLNCQQSAADFPRRLPEPVNFL
jgi:hypothetical protein